MARIAAVATAFPKHYVDQETLTSLLAQGLAEGDFGALEGLPERDEVERWLRRFHKHSGVEGRHLVMPPNAYLELGGLEARNHAWLECALPLAEQAVELALAQAGLVPSQIQQLTSTTVTGIATPSIEARLMNRMPFSPHLKRTPMFGLGCLAGAAGVARVADYLRGHPRDAAVLLAVELCSLTMQRDDISLANLVSSSLFGDGAAAVVLVGDHHPWTLDGTAPIPRVVDSRSVFFADTERVMGWDVRDSGFKIVLDPSVADLARQEMRPAIEAFLSAHGLELKDVQTWVTHPGGPKIIDALEESLELPKQALARTRESLAKVGNVSSVSVLCVLHDTLRAEPPPRGSYGLMIAMGPAFCAELVLLQW